MRNVEEKISVIIPVYQVENFLEKCVISVINQSYSNLEIILVDDGSLDTSSQICDDFARNEKRVKVVHKSNGGLSSARNVGLDVATGKYIFFLDSDDYLSLNAIKTLKDLLDETEADIALCNFLYVDQDGNELQEQKSPIRNELIRWDEILHKTIEVKGYYYNVAWNKLYKREIFEKLRYPVGKIHEDEYIIHEIYSRCKKVVCIETPLYYYVQHSKSIMGQGISYNNIDKIEAFMRRLCFFYKSNNSILQDGYKILLNTFWWYVFHLCELFGYDDKSFNKKMHSMLGSTIKYIPVLLKDDTRSKKERIALSILLISPKYYNKLFGGKKHGKE